MTMKTTLHCNDRNDLRSKLAKKLLQRKVFCRKGLQIYVTTVTTVTTISAYHLIERYGICLNLQKTNSFKEFYILVVTVVTRFRKRLIYVDLKL